MRYWSGAPNAHAPYRYSANPSDHVEESILASNAVKLVSPPSTNTEFIVETTPDADARGRFGDPRLVGMGIRGIRDEPVDCESYGDHLDLHAFPTRLHGNRRCG